MKKSLRTILVLTVATTALSTIPGYSAEELTGEPKKTTKVVSKGCCGCFAGLFTRKNAQKALDVLDEAVSLAQVGLTVAGAATGDERLTNIATGIGTGAKVIHGVTTDLSGPGGVNVGAVLTAVDHAADGALDITSQVAPGSKGAVSNVVRIIHASDDAASTLVGDGHPTTAGMLSAGGKIAGIVAGETGVHGAVIAESVLDGMGQAIQAQQHVTTAVNTLSPLPSTTA